MTDQNKTHGVPWQVRHAAERTRADLKAGGASYPDVRALLEYVESLIAAPQSPVAPVDEELILMVYRFRAAAMDGGRPWASQKAVEFSVKAEDDLIRAIRARLADAPTVSEPEWIDDPHDIEQGMMRNPKYKAPTVSATDGEDQALIQQIKQSALNCMPGQESKVLRSIVGQCCKLQEIRGYATRPDLNCDKAPEGWACTRGWGHGGPCAAAPTPPTSAGGKND